MSQPQPLAQTMMQSPPPANQPAGKPERHTVKLDDGAWAVIEITGTPDKKAKERLQKYVKYFILGDDE